MLNLTTGVGELIVRAAIVYVFRWPKRRSPTRS